MCPECLSKDSIIWDYKNGVIVCSACGVVIDRLYDYETNRLDMITRDQKEKTSLDYKEKVRRTSKHLRTCKNRINEYYKIIRRFNLNLSCTKST